MQQNKVIKHTALFSGAPTWAEQGVQQIIGKAARQA